jgi:hypothetical protein
MRLKAVATALVGVAAIPGAAGCGNDNTSSATHRMSVRRGLGAPGAKVRFVAPTEAQTVGSTVVVRVRLEHFRLAPSKVGQAARRGEGHLHFSMDQGKFDHPKYSGANGDEAVNLGVAGRYSPAVKPSIVYTHLPTGTHELEVYLANNDHTSTGIASFVSFKVRAGGAPPVVPQGNGSGY